MEKSEKQSVGLPFDRAEDFEEITFSDARNDYAKRPEYWHACHAMFFAREPDRILWEGKSTLHLKSIARIMVHVHCTV